MKISTVEQLKHETASFAWISGAAEPCRGRCPHRPAPRSGQRPPGGRLPPLRARSRFCRRGGLYGRPCRAAFCGRSAGIAAAVSGGMRACRPTGRWGRHTWAGNRGCRGRMWASAPTRNSLCLADEEHADGAGAAVTGDGAACGGDGYPPQPQILST